MTNQLSRETGERPTVDDVRTLAREMAESVGVPADQEQMTRLGLVPYWTLFKDAAYVELTRP